MSTLSERLIIADSIGFMWLCVISELQHLNPNM